jgi:uncharacterized protein YoxC
MAYKRGVTGHIPFLVEKAATTIDVEKSESSVMVRGFASMTGTDRQGDDIDPMLFDIDSFMKNPQVFIDHHLWLREDGNEVSVGLVKELSAARAVEGENGDIEIFDIRHMEKIDTVKSGDMAVAEDGDFGLWAVVEVREPGVVGLVKDGTISSFSWRGNLIEDDFGNIKGIDLMEISVVHIGAHPKARFEMAKSATPCNSYILLQNDGQVFERAILPDLEKTDVEEYHVIVKNLEGGLDIFPTTVDNSVSANDIAASVFLKSDDVQSVRVIKLIGTLVEDGVVKGKGFDVMSSLDRYKGGGDMWSEVYVDSLPDSCFAHIVKGGTLDEEGKTVPRSNRKLPIRNKAGKLSGAKVSEAAELIKGDAELAQAAGVIFDAAKDLGISKTGPYKKPTVPKKRGSQAKNKEGGVEDMTEEQVKTLETLVETVSGMSESMKTLSEAVTEKEKSTEEVVAEPEATEETSETKGEKSTDDSEVFVKTLSDIKDSIQEVAGSMSLLSDRVKNLEAAPLESGEATEEAEDLTIEEVLKSACADEENGKENRKALLMTTLTSARPKSESRSL